MSAAALAEVAGMSGTATVGVLFCDLAGSTELMSRLGDDANDAVLRRVFTALREAEASHGGREIKSTGDGVMVVFDQSVAAAVACGVAMQRGISRLADANPLLGLALRVGIAAGEANSLDGDWYGTPVNEAARLCAAALPGQILVSDVVRALVGTRGGHRFEAVGVLDLKGLPGGTPASEVMWQPAAGVAVMPLPAPLATSAGGPFVGRRRELSQLLDLWHEVALGHRRTVAIVGEAGSGTTRLVAEMATRAHDAGAVVLYGRCDDVSVESHQPFAEALRWYALSCPPEPLRAQVGPLGAQLGHLVPALHNRLPGLGPPRAAGDRHDELFHAVASFVDAVAANRPVVLVIDDVHHADGPTTRLLAFLVEWPHDAPVLLVAAGEAVPQPAADAIGCVVGLAGLVEDDVAALVRARLPDVDGDGPQLSRALVADTEGNPALVLEALDALAAGRDATAGLDRAPYKGLLPYESDDAAMFFGREELVDALLARLAHDRMVALVGASGSGKSSVLRAGIVAALGRGALPGSDQWPVVVMTPGAHPVRELAATLSKIVDGDAASALGRLEADPRALDVLVRAAVAPGGRAVLAIDQFEEMFTLCRDPAERERFVDIVLQAVLAVDGRTTVALAVRADFYARSIDHPALAAALDTANVVVPPMGEHELREAIEGPARAARLRLETGLADAVLRDALGEPGGLPLVSHALLETWRRRDGRTLTRAAYDAAGGVRGGIARTAESLYLDALDEREREVVRQIFVRLTEFGEGTEDTRRRTPLDELAALGDAEVVARLLHVLADARLVTLGERTAEVAHEALIREWPRLRAWLDDDRAGLRIHRHLTEAAAAWDADGRDPDELYRGARLAAAEEWAQTRASQLTATEHDFLRASRGQHEADAQRQARANRRLRASLATVGVLLVGAVFAGALALGQADRADEQAVAAEARRLAAQALVTEDVDEAILLALHGVRLDDAPATRASLLAVLERSPQLIGVVRSDGPRFLDLDVRPDGEVVAIGDNTSGVTFYDAGTRDVIGALDLGTGISAIRWRPDGTLLAVAQQAPGPPLLVDGDTFEPLAEQLGRSAEPAFATAVAFSGDGTRVAAALDLGEDFPPERAEVAVWDVAAPGRPIAVLPVDGFDATVVLDRAGATAYVAQYDGPRTTVAFDVASGEALRTYATGGTIALSPDETTLATVDGRDVVLVDTATGVERQRLRGHTEEPLKLRFAGDDRIITAGDDRLAIVWDVASGTPVETLRGHAGRVLGAGITPDGRHAFTAGLDRAMLVWDLDGPERLVRRAGSVPLSPSALAFVPDPTGRRFVVPSDVDDRVAVVDRETGDVEEWTTGHGGWGAWAFSPDGQTLATTGADGAVRVWDLAGGMLAEAVVGETYATGIAYAGGDRLVVGTAEGEVVVLEARTLDPVGAPVELEGQIGWVFAPTVGDVVAVAFEDRTELLDLATGEVRHRIEALAEVSWAAFSPDGRRLAVGTWSGRVTLADVDTGEPVAPPTVAHDGFVLGVAWSRDGTRFVTAGTDGPVLLWDGRTGEQLGTIQPGPPNTDTGAAFEGDGRTVTVLSSTGAIFEWDTDPAVMVRHACSIAGRELTPDEWSEVFGDAPRRAACADG